MGFSRSVGFMRRMNWGQHRDATSREVRGVEKVATVKEIIEETVLVPRCAKCGSPDHDDLEDELLDCEYDMSEFISIYTTETPHGHAA